ncbi:hypothetical protein [Haloferax prahovense]|uniref:hypothetical protein n=1 Tax=Haloferax prahovense TaxID=381852 RepID=UPI0012DD296C|nr:hypothetical protein [Haloferax prahovense]
MTTTISAKVSEDLAQRIEDAREDGETRSHAIGRLLRTGLEADPSTTSISLPIVLLWSGTLFLASAYADASGLIGPAGAVLTLGGVLLSHDDARAALLNVYHDLGQSDGSEED